MQALARNKKGASEILYFRLIGTLIGVLVIITLGFFIRDKASLEGLKKDFIAKDLALVLTSIYAAPGDVTYVYFVIEGEYEIKIGNSIVEVASPGGSGVHRYLYAEDDTMEGPELIAELPIEVIIKKRGDRITAEAKIKNLNDEIKN